MGLEIFQGSIYCSYHLNYNLTCLGEFSMINVLSPLPNAEAAELKNYESRRN